MYLNADTLRGVFWFQFFMLTVEVLPIQDPVDGRPRHPRESGSRSFALSFLDSLDDFPATS